MNASISSEPMREAGQDEKRGCSDLSLRQIKINACAPEKKKGENGQGSPSNNATDKKGSRKLDRKFGREGEGGKEKKRRNHDQRRNTQLPFKAKGVMQKKGSRKRKSDSIPTI